MSIIDEKSWIRINIPSLPNQKVLDEHNAMKHCIAWLVREGRHPGGHKEYVYDDILDDTWIGTNQTLRKTNDMILLLRLRLKNIYRLKESKKIDDIVVDRQ